MENGAGCPTCGSTSSAFRAISDAVLAITTVRAVEPILEQIVQCARELAGARYAAIGVPDGEGGFERFITAGMTDAQLDALGELPRTHGLLGAMLETVEPYRAQNIQDDPRFEGWPDEHPNMRSFLGVPIVSHGSVIGAFYLTEKRGRRKGEFTDADQELIEALAAHAAIAIENARLYERSRELSTIEERKRLASDLHDSVAQKVFSLSLSAQAAAMLVDTDPGRAKEELLHVEALARAASEEMRAAIFELRPAELEADGLATALRKHAEVLRRLHSQAIDVHVTGERRLPPDLEKCLFRIAQEALTNALKHGSAKSIRVDLELVDSRVSLGVSDDGAGFDPETARARSGRLGLVSMQERAESVGGTLTISSRPGEGTRVAVEVPHGGDHSRSRR
jgi:signal transduction histidine kinase